MKYLIFTQAEMDTLIEQAVQVYVTFHNTENLHYECDIYDFPRDIKEMVGKLRSYHRKEYYDIGDLENILHKSLQICDEHITETLSNITEPFAIKEVKRKHKSLSRLLRDHTYKCMLDLVKEKLNHVRKIDKINKKLSIELAELFKKKT